MLVRMGEPMVPHANPDRQTPPRGGFYLGDTRVATGPAEPVPPGEGEVSISVAYVGICGTDLHVVHGTMDHRVTLPQLIGHEMSGVVAEVGAGVRDLAVGDAAVVRPLLSCGSCPACRAGHRHICHRLVFLGIDAPGAMQERWTVPAHLVHRVPPEVPMRSAALVEPLAVACHDVRRADLAPGEHVAVLGAGPVGLLIALLARLRGAEVVIADVNPARLEVARDLGLEAVASQDLAAAVERATGETGADVVFEVSGSAAAVAGATGLLRTRGRLVIVGIHAEPHPVDLFRVFWRELTILGARVYEPEDFDEAIALAAGSQLPLERLVTSVVGLDELAAAFDELGSGGRAIKVLVEMGAER